MVSTRQSKQKTLEKPVSNSSRVKKIAKPSNGVTPAKAEPARRQSKRLSEPNKPAAEAPVKKRGRPKKRHIEEVQEQDQKEESPAASSGLEDPATPPNDTAVAPERPQAEAEELQDIPPKRLCFTVDRMEIDSSSQPAAVVSESPPQSLLQNPPSAAVALSTPAPSAAAATMTAVAPFPNPFLHFSPPSLLQNLQTMFTAPLPSPTLPPPSPFAAELNPVQRAIIEYASATRQDVAVVWQLSRQIAVQFTAQTLIEALQASKPFEGAPQSPLKPTAGVSYVVRSESKQIDVLEQEKLPHMVYRPPLRGGIAVAGTNDGELTKDSPEVAKVLNVLLNHSTVASVMPLKDENCMKTYLLEHEQRAKLLEDAGGSVQQLEGAAELSPVLKDRSFVCLHYKIDFSESAAESLHVAACSPGSNADQTPSACAKTLAESNLQLGIMIRKGVGGTYPLRSAAKKLSAQGLLGALMDENLPAAQPLASTLSAGFSGQHSLNSPESNEDHPDEGPPPAHQRLSLYTLTSRLELYVDQITWEKLNFGQQRVLQSAILHLEHHLRTDIERRNWEMLKDTLEPRLCAAIEETEEKNSGLMKSPLAAKLLPLLKIECSDMSSKLDYFDNSAVKMEEDRDDKAAPSLSSSLDFSTSLVLAAAVSSAPLALGGLGNIHIPWPLYFINTRDHFTYHLVPVETVVKAPDGRHFIKTEWFFKHGELPSDYHSVVQRCAANSFIAEGTTTAAGGRSPYAGNSEVANVVALMVQAVEASSSETAGGAEAAAVSAAPISAEPKLWPVGVTTYTDVLSSQQLATIESRCDDVDNSARQGRLPATCSHSTYGKGGSLKRTKFFFGARYLWTREQLSAPDAHVAKGVRVDVPPAPKWVHSIVETPLVAASVLPENHINSVALNMYHDGSEGIQVHFDDSARFQQPIYSLRLFSDSRLSFGTQLYGYTNGAFFIPMPRGCVTVMEAGSYAANGVKHCVRPVDMAGKSAGMILRRMNPTALLEAQDHFMDETIFWIKCLSLDASLRAESLLAAQAEGRYALGRPLSSNKITRQVAGVMETMIRSVERAIWEERALSASVASVMSRMLRGIDLAESAHLDFSNTGDAEIFSVLDKIVGYCEVMMNPKPLKRKYSSTGVYRKGLPGSKGAAGPKKPLPDVVEVAMVLQRMVAAVEATEKAEMQSVAKVVRGMVACVEAREAWELGGKLGLMPQYGHNGIGPAPGRSILQSKTPVQLMMLANGVAMMLLCGAVPVGLPVQDVQAAAQAAMVQSKLGNMVQFQAGLLVTARGGVGTQQQNGLTPVQLQVAAGCVYRLLCLAAARVGGPAMAPPALLKSS